MYGTQTGDEYLVAAVRAGDDRAFEQLYARYRRRIAAYIYGMVKDYGRSEEIAQDVFISALRRMRNTDSDIAFKPWIYEIAKNACIDQFRRGKRAELVSFDAEGGLGETDRGRLVNMNPEPDAAVDQKLSLDHLRGAFGGLSEAHHDILVMRELEGMSYRQIGERLGMSRASVESTLFRARKRLSEEYDELVSGERCQRVQAIVTSSTGASLGIRDQRRLARHISYCQPCRRHAAIAGVDVAGLLARPTLGSKIAAFLPVPAFLRERWDLPGRDFFGSSNASAVANWSAQMAPGMDPGHMATWAKAIVAAATVAIAGVGANEARKELTTKPAPAPNFDRPSTLTPGGALDRGTAPGEVAVKRQSTGSGTPAAADGTSSPLAPPATSEDPGLAPRSRRDGGSSLPGVLPRTDGPTTTDGRPGGGNGAPAGPGDVPQVVAPPASTIGDATTGLLSPPAEGSGPPNVGTAVQDTASTVLTPFMPSAPQTERQSGETGQPAPAWGLPQLPIFQAPQARSGDAGSGSGLLETTSQVLGSLVAP